MIHYFNIIYIRFIRLFYHLPKECLVPPIIFSSVTLVATSFLVVTDNRVEFVVCLQNHTCTQICNI